MARYVQDEIQLVKPGDIIPLKPRYLRKGSIVQIVLYKEDKAVTTGMLEYNGQERSIEKILRSKNGAVYGYELEGVCSKYGISYTFSTDMIR